MPRGQYDRPLIGAEPHMLIGAASDQRSALPWVVGAVAIGAILWARHETQKATKLYAAHGVARPSLGEDVGALAAELRDDVKHLAHRAREAASGVARGWRSKREG